MSTTVLVSCMNIQATIFVAHVAENMLPGADPVGGPEGPWPPQLVQNAPDFGPNAL